MKKPFIFISAFMLSLVLLVASVAEESIAIPTDKISEMTFSSMLSEDGQYQAAAVSLENLKQLYEEDVNELITELKEGSAAIAALESTKTNLFMIYACTSRKCHMLVYSFEDDEYTYTTEENKGWNPKEDVVGVCGYYKQKEICDTYTILEPNILLGALSQLSNVSSSSNAQSNESQNTQDDNLATEGYNRTITFESLEVSVEKGNWSSNNGVWGTAAQWYNALLIEAMQASNSSKSRNIDKEALSMLFFRRVYLTVAVI